MKVFRQRPLMDYLRYLLAAGYRRKAYSELSRVIRLSNDVAEPPAKPPVSIPNVPRVRIIRPIKRSRHVRR